MSSGAPSITVGRTEELMEPPGGTHTTTDLYSKLSADPTIFAKLRIKSEKADALAIGFDLAQWLKRQLFRTLSSALRNTSKASRPLPRRTPGTALPVRKAARVQAVTCLAQQAQPRKAWVNPGRDGDHRSPAVTQATPTLLSQ